MCVPDILNPFKICEFFCGILFLIVIFVVGGYFGKGLYLELNQINVESTFNLVRDSNFYIPDGYFWVFGTITIFILLVLYCLSKTLLHLISSGMKKMCISIFCLNNEERNSKKGDDKRKYNSIIDIELS